MAPTGTSCPPASSAQTPSASPGDGSPSGGDVAGESPSVPSPTPPPVDDEEEEVEEELPEEEEAPDDAADESMDAPSGRSSAQTPSRLLLLDRALALQGESTLPSGRDIPHWLTLDRSSDAPPGILKIQTKRARRHEGFRKKALALQKKLSTKLPSTIWNEPGVWKFPNKICDWILMDKQHFKPGTSECYSLQEQMELLYRREPARAQWSVCSTDAERIAHLPENVRRGLIPADERDPVTDIFS
uniref:Uncharacterized protein n=1 Tax=Phytophthora ramorum TaxID=164328 RepID=H3H8P1_PHYRM